MYKNFYRENVMIKKLIETIPFRPTVALAIACMFVVSTLSETKNVETEPLNAANVKDMNQLQRIIDTSGSRLLMFNIGASWCAPCKTVSSMLEKIASEYNASVSLYTIDMGKIPDAAKILDVDAIPLVLYVKNKQTVRAYSGIQPQDMYRRPVIAYGGAAQGVRKDLADGNLENGVRVIKLYAATSLVNLYLYEGENVKLLFRKPEFPFSVHIPAMAISRKTKAGEDLVVEFYAKDAGIFSMMCNGNYPVGDGYQTAKIIVMKSDTVDTTSVFKNIENKEAMAMITAEKPFILDVRSPKEFYDHCISGAVNIPVQQLSERIPEIRQFKDKPILVYCSLGIRSVLASNLLFENGFTRIYNLKSGSNTWKKAGFPIEKTK
jgi:rhodanese-related sulfurtransferase